MKVTSEAYSEKIKMTEEYKITLVPQDCSGRFFYRGKDYTTSAQAHSIIIDNIPYAIRQNSTNGEKLKEIVESHLDSLVKAVVGNGKLESPLTISLTLESDE